MKNAKYKLLKFLFGLFVILFSIRTFLELEENKNQTVKYISKYESDINHFWKIIKDLITDNFVEANDLNFLNFTFNFDNLKAHSQEIMISSSLLTFIGGLLMIYGYSIASAFVIFGFIIEFLFLHNYYYFKEEKMKVNVLKLIAVFGSLMHWDELIKV